MTNNAEWIVRVLEKLRLYIISGTAYSFDYGIWWKFDEEPSGKKEASALLFLASIGVISCSLGYESNPGNNPTLGEIEVRPTKHVWKDDFDLDT